MAIPENIFNEYRRGPIRSVIGYDQLGMRRQLLQYFLADIGLLLGLGRGLQQLKWRTAQTAAAEKQDNSADYKYKYHSIDSHVITIQF